MINVEPDRTPYDFNFQAFGIPVRVHPFFWIVTVLLGISASEADPIEMLLWVAVVFFSILIHELGHAFAARSYGMEPWITLHGFGGLASYTAYNQSTKEKVLISLAGPAAGFAFAALILLAIRLAGHGLVLVPSLMPVVFEQFPSRNLNILLYFLLFVNVVWGLVNLLPIYPLDGGQISRELFAQWKPYEGIRFSMMLSIAVAGAVAVYALLFYGSLYVTMMFGYLAYLSYSTLQAYSGGGRQW